MANAIPFNYARSQLTWDAQIRRWGGAALLRVLDGSGDIPCWAIIKNYTPQERTGQGYNPTDRRAIISVFVRDLTQPRASLATLLPSINSDAHGLATLDPNASTITILETFRFYTPTGKVMPAGNPIIYDMRVRAGTK